MMHVQIEPELQEITTEAMSGRSANTTIGAIGLMLLPVMVSGEADVREP